MADLGGDFDSGAISDERELLPDGEVLLQIFESELKDGDKGKTLILGWEIVSGPLQGRKLWTRHNVQHTNSQAQEIAQKEFKRIIKGAFGEDQRVRNSDVLHHKPMLATIVTKPARTDPATGKTYDPSNELRGWKFYGPNGSAPAAPSATAPQTQTSAAPAAKASVPWPSR